MINKTGRTEKKLIVFLCGPINLPEHIAQDLPGFSCIAVVQCKTPPLTRQKNGSRSLRTQ